MEVKVKHRLAGVGPYVGDQAPTGVEILFGRHLGSKLNHLCQHLPRIIAQLGCRCHVVSGDYEGMGRCLRIQIAERNRVLVASQYLGWNVPRGDLTEETVFGQSPVIPSFVSRSAKSSSL